MAEYNHKKITELAVRMVEQFQAEGIEPADITIAFFRGAMASISMVANKDLEKARELFNSYRTLALDELVAQGWE